MVKVEFTEEEVKSMVVQIGTRLDDLKEKQKEAGKNENIDRVLQLEEFMKPIRAAYQKLMDSM